MDLELYSERRLPALAALARAHVRLVPPGLCLSEREVVRGLEWHAHWPFYARGLGARQVQLATQGKDVLAALQLAWTDAGWGYGAQPGDGPSWLRAPHPVVAWVFAWPGDPTAADAAEVLLERACALVRSERLPGLEAFRGGPGFAPFGCQLSSRWPHLWAPLAAAGFVEPRELLVYGGETAPDALAPAPPVPEGLVLRHRPLSQRRRRPRERTGDAESGVTVSPRPRVPASPPWGRLEAWLDGEPVGICEVLPLGAGWAGGMAGEEGFTWQWQWDDPRAAAWAVVRRITVRESHRGRGIGAALLHGQLTRLSEHGCTRYLLHTLPTEEETPARALFTKLGAAVLDRQYVLRCVL